MAYIDFPSGNKGMRERKEFWLSPDGITLIDGWRKQGVPLDEIATRYIGIGTTTMWRWQKESPELDRALNVSKQVVDDMVVNALLRRALGYDYQEVTEELVEGAMRTTKVVTKHMAPDVKACLSWLYSRQSQYWRAVQEPIDDSIGEIDKAKKMLAVIKEVADGYSGTTEPEAG